MAGRTVRESEAVYAARFPKTVLDLRAGARIDLKPGDRVRITVDEYEGAFIDGHYVGQAHEFTEEG